jgi:AcrR family transcriptional regulator
MEVAMTGAAAKAARSTYRHGDLRQALITAAAAYRHFADRKDLLDAVCAVAQAAVATAMEAEQAALPHTCDRAKAARMRLRAVGTGYLRFAHAEPGLFRTAFTAHADLSRAGAAEAAGAGGLTPFQILSAALDGLVEVNVLPVEHRPGAEFLAWSAVHGLAMLIIDGPLRVLDADQIERISDRLLNMVDKGL